MTKDSLIDSINYVANNLAKEPVTYINTAAIAVSMSNVELALKIVLYVVSITASILVSRKYLLEIKKLKENKPTDND
jgi:hypothetical protein